MVGHFSSLPEHSAQRLPVLVTCRSFARLVSLFLRVKPEPQAFVADAGCFPQSGEHVLQLAF